MISAYHRPETIEQALALLSRKHIKSVPLVSLDAHLAEDVDEVVDLQVLPLRQIKLGENTASIGSGVYLQTILEDERFPAWLRAIVKSEEPNTFRNMRTLYSIIQNASAESGLLAALLVCDASLSITNENGTQSVTVSDYLKTPVPGLITAVQVNLDGRVSEARVGRTPADTPIVAAVGRRGDDGHIRLALCGVATVPIMIDPAGIADLKPRGDFRGSSVYRHEMAQILIQRVLNALT